MPQPKFQLYKHNKISGKWRYCRAAVYSNGKVKPHAVVIDAQEEKHEEGSYCIRHKKSWIEAGTDPLEAQRIRSKLVDQTEYTAVQPAAITKSTSLAQSRSSRARRQEHPNLPHGRRPIRPHLQEGLRRRRDQAGHARLHGLAPQAALAQAQKLQS